MLTHSLILHILFLLSVIHKDRRRKTETVTSSSHDGNEVQRRFKLAFERGSGEKFSDWSIETSDGGVYSQSG